MSRILGIHHVTAIASDPQRNLDFYGGMLGLRLVKRTVNFDDPQTYHLYYGDATGSPGSIMTFFPWPGARPGRQGVGEVAVTSFAIRPASLGFWSDRLAHHGIAHEAPIKRVRGGVVEQVISFRDHDGLMLELVAHPGAEDRGSWGEAPGIPHAHAIHGFHGVTLWLRSSEPTGRVLEDSLGFRQFHEDAGTKRYVVGAGGPAMHVDLRTVSGVGRGASGAGIVHHVAWAVEDDASELEIRARVADTGLHPTPVIDRQYFHSVYFREPGGVLFELATVPPGFAIDEPVARLGERLMLPPQFEPQRSEIEAVLPRIHLAVTAPAAVAFADVTGPEDVSGDALGFVHRYIPPLAEAELAGGTTLLLLHGSGGDEEDLIPLGRELLPGAAILSPRGKVRERGMPRFFRRVAEGVFDQKDLATRTAELADFIAAATKTYELRPDGIVAVGFSNGANIAASILLRRPGLLRGAVLLSPVIPFEMDALPDLRGTPVFIGAGRSDGIAPFARAERLAELLRHAGADVTVHEEPGGHVTTPGEVEAARRWIARCLTTQRKSRSSERVIDPERGIPG